MERGRERDKKVFVSYHDIRIHETAYIKHDGDYTTVHYTIEINMFITPVLSFLSVSSSTF